MLQVAAQTYRATQLTGQCLDLIFQLCSAVVRKIIYGDTAFHYDCVLEQRGFELSVSRETSPTENPREYWENFAAKFASIVQRIRSLSVRHAARY